MANKQKTAIVTGASQGIGAGLVRAFLDRGYNVVANSRKLTQANTFTESEQLALVDGDIGKPETAEKLVDVAKTRFGCIDVLVNNAGLLIPKAFTDYTTDDFNTLVSTILAGYFYPTQHAVKPMLAQRSGCIINISTMLVSQPNTVCPAALQIMVKGGVEAISRGLAIEYATQGIRFNTISAGAIDTPMHVPEAHEFLKALQPMGRMGTVKEIVDAVLFLVDADFTTGVVLHVDGGAHAGKW